MNFLKKHIIYLDAILIVVMIFGAWSCSKEETHIPVTDNPVPATSQNLTPYTIKTPPFFAKLEIPEDNQPFVERIQLGRMLYYDNILSNDGRACANCHLQSYGFTIPGTVANISVLPHVNLGWYQNFMWDGSKTGNLEDVMLFETQEFFATDLQKLNNNEKYKTLFKQCYDVDYITHKEIAYALAQFTRTMISGDSKYDRYLRGQTLLSFNEERGRQLFFSEKGDCFHCHSAVFTTDNLMHNTGLDSIYSKKSDKGYYNVTNNPKDLGKFRTPTLRNVALRQYYMHDGRFTKLEEVIDFYDHKVHVSENIDPIMVKSGKEDGLNLSTLEKQQLVAFLKTFTDSTFIYETSFSKP